MRNVVTIGLAIEDINIINSAIITDDFDVRHLESSQSRYDGECPQLIIINQENEQDIYNLIVDWKRMHGCSIIVIGDNFSSAHRLNLMWVGVDEVLLSPYHSPELVSKILLLLKQYQLDAIMSDQQFKRELYNTEVIYNKKRRLLVPKCYDLLVFRCLSEDSNLTKLDLIHAISDQDLSQTSELADLIADSITNIY